MNHQYDWQVGQQLMCALCGKMDYHEGPEECPGTGAGNMLSLRDLDKRNDRESAPVLNDDMKIGHFGGIKPGDIVPSADIYESNWGETIAEAKNWFPNGVVKNRPGFVTKEAYDELMAHLQLCVTRAAHENVVNVLRDEICQLKEKGKARYDYAKAKLLQENARLKARIRELEPEQPAPRPLYRWGRPV